MADKSKSKSHSKSTSPSSPLTTSTQMLIVSSGTSTVTTNILVIPSTSSIIVTRMAQPAQRPWTKPGAVNMVAPLHDLPDHPEKWLPYFSPDSGVSTE